MTILPEELVKCVEKVLATSTTIPTWGGLAQWDNVTFDAAKQYAIGFTSSSKFVEKYRRLGEICENNVWMELLFPNKKHLPLTIRAKMGKLVNQYTLDGTLITTHKSMLEAAKCVNGTRSSISGVCRGKRPSAYGFIWKYANAA